MTDTTNPTSTPPTNERAEHSQGASARTSPFEVLVPPWVRRSRARKAADRARAGGAPEGTGTAVVRRRGGTAPVPGADETTDVTDVGTGESIALVQREVETDPGPWWLQVLRWSRHVAEDSILISTNQGEVVNPLLVATHPPMAGPPDGIDLMTNNVLTLDPHLLYANKLSGVTTVHVAVIGVVGSAKTSFTMTKSVVRQVAMGRQVAVFDRKKTQSEGIADRGEYADACRICAGSMVRFSPGGAGVVLNLMDPALGVDQMVLLELAAQYAHERPLEAKERAALTAARDLALSRARGEGRVANIRDVIEALFTPTAQSVPHPNLAEEGIIDHKTMISWGMDLALNLRRFVDGDLAGLIDGETSDGIDWEAPLLVFDTSDIPENSAALSLVMMLVTTFLTNVWSAKPRQRVLVLEEGYHTTNLAGAGGVTVPGLLKSLVKRGRGIGLSFVIVIHHITDIPADSDAVSLVKEAGLIHIYRQDKWADIKDIVDTYGLPPEVAGMLETLPQGVQIAKVGTDAPRLMRHIRSSLEEIITDSDSALAGRAKHSHDAELDTELDAELTTGGRSARAAEENAAPFNSTVEWPVDGNVDVDVDLA